MNRRIFLMSAGAAASCTRDSRPRLNVWNWSSYIDPETVARFEKERGVRVRYGTYESNEEMLARVVAGNSGWDIVFPTHSRLAPMGAHGLLAPLDRKHLPALGNLHTRFEKPAWDPDLRLGIPYLWNGTGIVYNRRQTGDMRRWSDLWRESLRGRMTMLDDPEDTVGACLLKLSLPFSTVDKNELRRAKGEALRQKPLLRAYLNAEVRDQLVSGDVLAAQLWSTTASQAIHGSSDLDFAWPEEGFPLYCDCAAILAESSRRELAHEFLNFLLLPDVAAANAKVAESATANGPAQVMLPRDPVLYPVDDVYRRGVWPPALGSADQKYRDRLWTEIKSG